MAIHYRLMVCMCTALVALVSPVASLAQESSPAESAEEQGPTLLDWTVPLPSPGLPDEPAGDLGLTLLAQSVMLANPPPWVVAPLNQPSIPVVKQNKSMMGGMINDDPLWMPNFDMLFNVAQDGGYDVFLSVDPAHERPGAGEVDGHTAGLDPMRRGPRGDLFILGDHRVPYYAGKTSAQDRDRDLVYVAGFDAEHAQVRLHGAPEDYVVVRAYNPDLGPGLPGAALFLRETEDMIAYFRNTAPDHLDLNNPNQFLFDTPPSPVPAVAGIAQPAGPGAVLGYRPYHELDDEGNVYFMFGATGPVDLPKVVEYGPGVIYVVKYSPQGEQLWAGRYGSPLTETAHGELPFGLVVDGGHVFVYGGTEGTYGERADPSDPNESEGGLGGLGAFLTKLDADTGEELKVRQYFDPVLHSVFWQMIADDAGNLYGGGGIGNYPMNSAWIPLWLVEGLRTGSTQQLVLEGWHAPIAPLFVKIDQETLELEWMDTTDAERNASYAYSHGHLLGGASIEALSGAAFIPDGSGVPGQGSILQAGYNGTIPENNILTQVLPLTGLSLHTTWDIFYALHDQDGNVLWEKTLDTDDHIVIWDTRVGDDGYIYMVGTTFFAMGEGQQYTGAGDALVVKVDPEAPSGQQVWARTLGTDASDNFRALVMEGNTLYILGDTRGSWAAHNAGEADVVVATMSTDGVLGGVAQYGSERIDLPFALKKRGRELLISGVTEGSMVASNGGSTDAFLFGIDTDSVQGATNPLDEAQPAAQAATESPAAGGSLSLYALIVLLAMLGLRLLRRDSSLAQHRGHYRAFIDRQAPEEALMTTSCNRFAVAVLATLIVASPAALAQDQPAEDPAGDLGLTLLAQSIMLANPPPWVVYPLNQPSIPAVKQNKSMMGGMMNDDPLWMPNFDMLFNIGQDGGYDVFLSVDPAKERPGAGEVDAHTGGLDPMPRGPRGDLFILGDHRVPYYAGKTSAQDRDRDLVYIAGFDAEHAQVRLHGAPEDYVVVRAYNPDLGPGLPGAALFLRETQDMIAYFRNTAPDQLDLNDPDQFLFDTPPSPVPAVAGIAQPAGPGAVLGYRPYHELDDEGNVYFMFGATGPVDVPNLVEYGPGVIHVVKYSPQGEQIWAGRYGSPLTETAHGELPFGLVVDGGHVFVYGGTEGTYGERADPDDSNASEGGLGGLNAFLAKLDAETGEELKARQYFDPVLHSVFWQMLADNDGNLYGGGGIGNHPMNSAWIPLWLVEGLRTGTTQQLALEGWHAPIAPLFVKIDQETLELEWTDTTDARRNASFAYAHGNLIGGLSIEALSGSAFIPDSSGVPGKGTILQAGYNGTIPENNFLNQVVPLTGLSIHTTWDIFYALHDDEGNVLWEKTLDADDHIVIWDTRMGDDGYAYMVGTTFYPMGTAQNYAGAGDALVVKVDLEAASGDFVWARTLGTDASDNFRALVIEGNTLYILGDTRGSWASENAGEADAVVATMSTDGELLGVVQYGSERIDFPFGLKKRGSELLISGVTEGSMVAPNGGSTDAFLFAIRADSVGSGARLPNSQNPGTSGTAAASATESGGSLSFFAVLVLLLSCGMRLRGMR